ncbi:MAG: hypothetical protein ABSF22_27320 [Bryobacteraceae bacterium]
METPIGKSIQEPLFWPGSSTARDFRRGIAIGNVAGAANEAGRIYFRADKAWWVGSGAISATSAKSISTSQMRPFSVAPGIGGPSDQ